MRELSAKKIRSLKRMSRDGLILLIRDLTLDNEQLRAEMAALAAAPIALERPPEDASLLQEIRSLRGSMNALLDNLKSRGDVLSKAVQSAGHAETAE